MKKLLLLLIITFISISVDLKVSAAVTFNINNHVFASFQDKPSVRTSELKIFPNPVTVNKFTVSAGKNIESIQLNNILGQKTEIDFNKKNDLVFEVSFKEKKQGIYLITILFEDKSKEVKRIIVN